ncbi:gap junction delta-3 protein-like [Pseudochaenichthys georgianus]|uniref:gap junction delta-3 protein-like n=1 Tax=Pseudochaenichthys georgianus TaxID=52239 RepID=UPI00146B385A|nr:gap junction delta-3 protein-like [Pseudochaenichthys georgianus]
MLGARDLLFITISQNVSFVGKTWWMLMLVLRLPAVLLAGFTLFSDEQETFVCNTIQPGCSNVCFDAFAPVCVFRLWLFHLTFLCLPHVLFVTYVMHRVWSNRHFVGFYWDRKRGGSPFTLENSSREVSLHKAPLHDLPHDVGAPRFYCTYFLVVILRILLEMVFGAGQFLLFGLSVPKRFLCYETPCNSGVECYISKPTEKTLMLNFMLGVASLSILLSLVDLVSSTKATVRRRRQRERMMDEMSKGEQSSVFTTTSTTEDSDVVITRKISRCESSKNGFKDERHAVPNGERTGTANDKSPENKEGEIETSPPIPTHYVLHSQLRPPQSPRPERGPPTNARMLTPVAVGKQVTAVKEHSGQQSDGSDNQDKRAWV